MQRIGQLSRIWYDPASVGGMRTAGHVTLGAAPTTQDPAQVTRDFLTLHKDIRIYGFLQSHRTSKLQALLPLSYGQVRGSLVGKLKAVVVVRPSGNR